MIAQAMEQGRGTNPERLGHYQAMGQDGEGQIERVMQATVGMYGDMQGIAGKSLQEIEGLEMKALEGLIRERLLTVWFFTGTDGIPIFMRQERRRPDQFAGDWEGYRGKNRSGVSGNPHLGITGYFCIPVLSRGLRSHKARGRLPQVELIFQTSKCGSTSRPREAKASIFTCCFSPDDPEHEAAH